MASNSKHGGTHARDTRFWNKRSKAFDARVNTDSKKYRKRLNILKNQIKETDCVLDLGCASGAIVLDVAAFSKLVVGIDISPAMIELAKARQLEQNVSNAEFYTGTVESIPATAHPISVVMALNVLHLVANPNNVLNAIANILPTGGKLIAEVPCLAESRWVVRLLLKTASRLHLAPTVQFFSKADVDQWLTVNGFWIERSTAWSTDGATKLIIATKVDRP